MWSKMRIVPRHLVGMETGTKVFSYDFGDALLVEVLKYEIKSQNRTEGTPTSAL
jgi:hypothetical protein